MKTDKLRLQAQRRYLIDLQQALHKYNAGEVGVFVMPVFDNSGKNTGKVVRETKSQTNAMVMVMSYTITDGKEKFKTALIFAPATFLKTKYHAGENIGGKIVTKYTFGKGNSNDIMFAIGTDVPCVNENGLVIYQTQYWDSNLNTEDDPTPFIANMDEIKKAIRIAITKNKQTEEDDRYWARMDNGHDQYRDAARDAIRGMDEETDGFWRDL